ncbi:unnamed protein product [Scytosiphon promiscuus]
MAPLKETTAVVVAALWLASVDSFLTPVPVGTSRTRAANRALVHRQSVATNGVQARPQQHDAARQQSSMSAAPGKVPSSGIGGDGSTPASTPRPSRLSRISGRVRKMIRKAIMGYVPEEEVSYKERAAQQAAAAARLRGEPEIADERLREDSVSAKSAAIQAVEESLSLEDDEDDILNSGFVQLNIGDQSPMEAEDKLSSLRIESWLSMIFNPSHTSRSSPSSRRRKCTNNNLFMVRAPYFSSRLTSLFDGDTVVAERPSSTLNPRQAQTNEGSDARPTESTEAPKLASAEDIERLNRMFGYGEPLR